MVTLRNACFLIGPAGTGKTTLAHLAAKEFSEYIELNASDKRSYDIINNTIGEASASNLCTVMDLNLLLWMKWTDFMVLKAGGYKSHNQNH